MPFVITPKILLPKENIDLNKWAVIACDQFTSEPHYWLELKMLVGNQFSTLKMILPEVFLEQNASAQIAEANKNMSDYLKINIFNEIEAMVLVERKTPYRDKRLGLVLAIDLESYEYKKGVVAPILASEETVAERIPPRVKIRENAPIESPHVLVLIDDQDSHIIDKLYEKKDELVVLYDFDLNMGGGHLKGYKVINTEKISHKLMASTETIKMVVGDGNHSLASAKVYWDTLKKSLPENEFYNHPARYALVEVISLYDKGLTFEPIHRILFNPGKDFIKTAEKKLSGDGFTMIYDGKKQKQIAISTNPFIAIKEIQEFLDEYLKIHPETKIDFVHGLDSLTKIVDNNKNAIGIQFPPLKRDELFPYVKSIGSLPRKSFSLGEALEKRYYMECRSIRK